MADIMRPVPFSELLNRIFSEYKENQSIFSIPAKQFYHKENEKNISVWGEQSETPVGPAAGPHTQLTQNIVCSWLAGGRFMELKTVQKLDKLEIPKPCIDAEDECFNTEWSSEFTLLKSYDEYLKAWFVLHLLEALFTCQSGDVTKSFVFNMSVGYDLEGIKTAPMQAFIDDMLDASQHPKFAQYQTELLSFINDSPLLAECELSIDKSMLSQQMEKISAQITQGVTLSTLHGCPSDEIEAICRYMLEEKKVNTYVKLNPTLLGYPRVRSILDQSGFSYIALSEEAFSHDLQIEPAKAMLHRLVKVAKENSLGFGVKLTNTLGTLNNKGKLADKEMYMSGRALFPLSINLAFLLSKEFNGSLPISYSGGASKFNIREIFETGIRPITMATDLLKPGGYGRLTDCVNALDDSSEWQMSRIDLAKLEALAEKSLTAAYGQKEWKGPEAISVNKAVPLTDCSIAPCVTACPISQDIPEYIRLMGEKKYPEALNVIYERNALPSITGNICDHECQYNCTRRDYEGAVNIREMKKIALKEGWEAYKAQWNKPELDATKQSVAVIGAGPAGLSAAYFLARAGYPVTILEKEKDAGGVVKHIIPQFRIPEGTLEHDINFVQEHGVNIEYGSDPSLNIAAIKARGYQYVCLAVGADKGNPFALQGDNDNVYKSLNFLRQFNDSEKIELGKHVVVVGGGNTAMDSARAALKVQGVEKVTVLYRRTQAEMPAHKGEYDLAVKDGVEFKFLTNPQAFDANGTMTVTKMELGEKDAQGRRRPVDTGEIFELEASAIITAIGEQTNRDALTKMGLPMGQDGWPSVDAVSGETQLENVFLLGDAQTGPSSIVSAIAGGRKVADSILAKEAMSRQSQHFDSATKAGDIYARKGTIAVTMIEADELKPAQQDSFVAQEASRCLECSYVCSKCVDVCPNRANIALPIPGFANQQQVLHIDAFCNECGNCAQFCPWDSKPYKDKFTIFSLLEDFEDSTNSGFYVEGSRLLMRQDSKISEYSIDDKGITNIPDSDEAKIAHYVLANNSYLLTSVEV